MSLTTTNSLAKRTRNQQTSGQLLHALITEKETLVPIQKKYTIYTCV